MPSPEIAAFGRRDDKQVLAFQAAARRKGVEAPILPLQLAGQERPLVCADPAAPAWAAYDLTQTRAVYLRGLARNTLPTLPPLLNPTAMCEWRAGFLREQEYQAATHAFFGCLSRRGSLVVNPPSTYLHHDTKAQFYERLRRAGCPVPRAVSTTDPGEARRFIDTCRRAVMKPAIGVGSTREVTGEYIERLDDTGFCPVLFQEFIDGPTLRVHVVGRTVVLPLEIAGEGIDSRTGDKTFHRTRLPADAAADLARAMDLLGLHFAAWDVIRARDGKHYLLDCNPGPYLMWIGEDNVQAVYEQLVGYMLAFAREGSEDAARQAVREVA